MNFQVGKWCRTKNGTIFKIIGGNIDMWEIDISYNYLSKCENEDYTSYAYNKNNNFFEHLVIKTSYDIIDLIKVGDYVNGSRVVKINCNFEYVDDDADTGVNEVDNGLILENNSFIYFGSEITSIVTKEQFEQASYKK